MSFNIKEIQVTVERTQRMTFTIKEDEYSNLWGSAKELVETCKSIDDGEFISDYEDKNEWLTVNEDVNYEIIEG